MAKKQPTELKIPLFLYAVIFIFILSGISSLYLLFLKLYSIFRGTALIGVYISCILLIFYCFFLFKSLYLMLKLKTKAIKTGIIAIIFSIVVLFWINIMGYILFLGFDQAIIIIKGLLPRISINLLLALIILVYFIKSKELKELFCKK